MISKWMGAFIFLLALMTGTAFSVAKGQDAEQQLAVEGEVVAYEQSAMALAKLTFVPNIEVFIVRVEHCDKCKEKPHYIKIRYRYWHNEPTLPSEIFKIKNLWCFKLTRLSSCDGSLQGLESKGEGAQKQSDTTLPRLIRTPWSQAENIPTDVVIPCYELRPEDFKLSGNAR